MTPALDHRSAARILDLADPVDASSGPRKARAMAATVLLFAISAIAAHATVAGGSPTAALGADSFSARAGRAHAAATQESSHMHRLMAVAASGAVAMGSSAFAQDAVQWRVEDGWNGHWYQALTVSPLPSSRNAQELFAAGLGGTMAIIDAAQENVFVLSLLSDIGSGERFGVWIGLYSPNSNAAWQWTDGTPVTWTGWGGANCASGPYPNDTEYAAERGTMIYRQNCGVIWDDTPTAWIASPPGSWVSSTNMKLLIEWSSDCNADGVVDYGQIRAGELDDANANNIPDCCEAGTACGCAADISGNGVVDAVDLAAVLSSWGNAPTGKTNADINRDGEINAIDLAEVLSSWGACP